MVLKPKNAYSNSQSSTKTVSGRSGMLSVTREYMHIHGTQLWLIFGVLQPFVVRLTRIFKWRQKDTYIFLCGISWFAKKCWPQVQIYFKKVHCGINKMMWNQYKDDKNIYKLVPYVFYHLVSLLTLSCNTAHLLRSLLLYLLCKNSNIFALWYFPIFV